jgi:hypothetical protein
MGNRCDLCIKNNRHSYQSRNSSDKKYGISSYSTLIFFYILSSQCLDEWDFHLSYSTSPICHSCRQWQELWEGSSANSLSHCVCLHDPSSLVAFCFWARLKSSVPMASVPQMLHPATHPLWDLASTWLPLGSRTHTICAAGGSVERGRKTANNSDRRPGTCVSGAPQIMHRRKWFYWIGGRGGTKEGRRFNGILHFCLALEDWAGFHLIECDE